ncbi:uncharacterized protein LOC117102725 isoform X2 [Anneissia japonica]|nr:uncharacterized protein LOC117102725 isoform X2 [Anneissia japonica]
MTSFVVRIWILIAVFVQAHLGFCVGFNSTSSFWEDDYYYYHTNLESVHDDMTDICLYYHQTCQGKCGAPPTHGSMCHCDSFCELYGDCCYDYRTHCRHTDNNVRNSFPKLWDRTVCIDKYYYLITKCGTETVDEEIRLNCEQPNQDNLLLKIPVSDASNLSYLNIYCALCNGVPMTDIVAWKVYAKCMYTYKSENLDLFNEELEEPTDQPVTKQSKKTMAPTIQISLKDILSEIDRADVCLYRYEPLKNYSRRYCSGAEGIKQCPLDYPDINIVNECKKYIASVYDNFETRYANAHCALCNGIENYTCKSTRKLVRAISSLISV